VGLQGAAPAVGDTDAAWSADANAITGQGLYARSEPVLGEQEMHLVVQLRREGVDAWLRTSIGGWSSRRSLERPGMRFLARPPRDANAHSRLCDHLSLRGVVIGSARHAV